MSVPGAGLAVKFATQVGRPYDIRTVEQDVRYLWSFGRFDDIRVEAAEGPDHGVAVVFRATPRRFFTIHEVSAVPNSFGIAMALAAGARIDRERAHEVALDAEKQLHDRGFPNARVAYELMPAVHDEVDLKLKIEAGDAVRVREVVFTGGAAVPPAEPRRALHALRPRRILPRVPHVWNGWWLLPAYTQSAVDADVARLRSYYFFKGYFDSDVQATAVDVSGTSARVEIEVHAGPRYAAVPPDFCSTLFRQRRAAERAGVLEFSAAATVDAAGQLSWRTEQGRPYRVGRIEFIGNHRYRDAFVRRNFVIDEGQPFDERRLGQSVARLNRTNLFENIDERSVTILRNPETGVAGIHVRLTERNPGAWSISGPAGPMSFAGPIEARIGRRLPPWGRGVLELSTYAASFSVYGLSRPLVPVLGAATNRRWFSGLSLERPYTPGEGWRSGFAIAPQPGWRPIATRYLAAQLEQRVLPLLDGDRGLVPELPVTVHRPAGDTTIVCGPPTPRLGVLRRASGMALQAFAALSGF